MGYHAAHIGTRDLRHGVVVIRALADQSDLPMVSANLLVDGQHLVAPATIVTHNRKRILITGATEAPRALRAMPELAAALETVTIADPLASITAVLDDPQWAADAVIVFGTDADVRCVVCARHSANALAHGSLVATASWRVGRGRGRVG